MKYLLHLKFRHSHGNVIDVSPKYVQFLFLFLEQNLSESRHYETVTLY